MPSKRSIGDVTVFQMGAVLLGCTVGGAVVTHEKEKKISFATSSNRAQPPLGTTTSGRLLNPFGTQPSWLTLQHAWLPSG
jgi:hypothetical protein